MFPPGRPRLATRPAPNEKITSGSRRTNSSASSATRDVASRRVAVLQAHGLTVDIAECFETANKRIDHREIGLGKEQDADLRHPFRLLRACRERPCRRRGAANEADEIAPFHVRHGFLPMPSR